MQGSKKKKKKNETAKIHTFPRTLESVAHVREHLLLYLSKWDVLRRGSGAVHASSLTRSPRSGSSVWWRHTDVRLFIICIQRAPLGENNPGVLFPNYLFPLLSPSQSLRTLVFPSLRLQQPLHRSIHVSKRCNQRLEVRISVDEAHGN